MAVDALNGPRGAFTVGSTTRQTSTFEIFIDLAIAIIVVAVAVLVADGNAMKLAAVGDVVVEILEMIFAAHDDAGAVVTGHLREGRFTDMGTGIGGAARSAGAAVSSVGAGVVVLADRAVAVVVRPVAAVLSVAVIGRHGDTDHAARLAAVLVIAIVIGRTWEAATEHAAPIFTVRDRVRQITDVPTFTAVACVGLQIEVFVYLIIAIIVSTVAELGATWNTTIGRRVGGRGLSVTAEQTVRIDLTAGEQREENDPSHIRKCSHGPYPTAARHCGKARKLRLLDRNASILLTPGKNLVGQSENASMQEPLDFRAPGAVILPFRGGVADGAE